ncbi:ATP-binding protein [Streptomyces sp. NPDC001985]|uniref:ATP-binding protein n=1 Tax=Streptomyces sp. NPDC001985 TaxID=3154406 RepID=UPI003317AD4B
MRDTGAGTADGGALSAAIAAVLARVDAHASRAGGGTAEGAGAPGDAGEPGARTAGESGGTGPRPGGPAGREAGRPSTGATGPGGGRGGGGGVAGAGRAPGAGAGATAETAEAAPGAAAGGRPSPKAREPGSPSARAAGAGATAETAGAAPGAAADGGPSPKARKPGSAGARAAGAAGPVAEPPVPGTLAALASCFGLTPFECGIVLLTAAVELEPTAGGRCAAASGHPERTHATFSLALAALPDPHWSALTPVGPLRRWRLIELDDESRLTTSRLRLDERVLHFLAGSPYLDARLHGLLRRTVPPPSLPSSYEDAAGRVAAGWQGSGGRAPLRVELVGGDLRSRADIAADAARRCGLGLYAMAADDLPADPAERDRLTRLWQREAILLPAALLVEAGDDLERDRAAATDAFVESAAVPLVVSSPGPRRTGRPRGERVTVPDLGPEEQLGVWEDAFAAVPEMSRRQLKDLVAQFSLPPHLIRAAGAAVARDLPGAAEPDPAALAWRAGLAEARVGMDELGRRIEPRASWDDLVLAGRQSRILREIVAHVRRRATVYQEWGFAATLRRGLGVTALFAGGSGTGKTLAAEVMARELGLDLFVIDLSQVVSKYIGETEKNLRRVFDAAERGGALLLFDEADALFGKRSEVRDSHDRYANLEVSYLLMRMEAYRGLAVLTTNMKQALDTAFLRRIRFVVDFPFPGEGERAEIWRRVLPARAPVKGIDCGLLARLTVAGGSIRNIALSGAFLAAEEGDRLQMRHMLEAARTEYLKLDRSLTPSEVHGWV